MNASYPSYLYDLAFAGAVLLMASFGVVSACRVPETERASPSEVAAPSESAAPGQSATPSAATNPLVGMSTFEAEFSATVAESVSAGGYAYLRLTTAEGEDRWLATMGAGAEPGARVQVHAYGSRDDFHSRRTGRTFDQLLFGEITNDPQ